MIEFAGRGVLLDVEGTVAPIAFVADALFPYARRELPDFLARRWGDPAVARARELVAYAGAPSFAAWVDTADPERQRQRVVDELNRLMEHDAKATGLKEVQGLIWDEGYRAGRLRSPVYADVPPALRAWAARGLDVRVYSSGSVAAQRAFFAHTEAGDLLGLFRGHYDTTTGPKRDPASYSRIAADMGLPPGDILFLSDVHAELEAARAAEMQAGLVVRPGNAPVSADTSFPTITSFEQVGL